jgi:hypothetical protein
MFVAIGEMSLHRYDDPIEWNGPFIITYKLPSSVLSPQHSIYFGVQYVEGEDQWPASSNSVAALTPLNSETSPFGSRWPALVRKPA